MKRKSILAVSAVAAGLCLSAPSYAHGVYAKAGILGAGIGYSYSLNDRFTVRSDVTTAGSYKLNRTVDDIDYRFGLKADQIGVYGDWFVFSGGLRVSAGLNLRKLQLDGTARPSSANDIDINGITVAYGPGDSLTGRVKFPSTAPYLGIGWGHHGSQKPGFGFVFDLGVSFGKPKVSLTVSDSLKNKLDIATKIQRGDPNATADAEIAAELDEVRREADKLKVFPQLYLGVSYRF